MNIIYHVKCRKDNINHFRIIKQLHAAFNSNIRSIAVIEMTVSFAFSKGFRAEKVTPNTFNLIYPPCECHGREM